MTDTPHDQGRRSDDVERLTKWAKILREWGQTLSLMATILGAFIGGLWWVNGQYRDFKSSIRTATYRASESQMRNREQDDALMTYGEALKVLLEARSSRSQSQRPLPAFRIYAPRNMTSGPETPDDFVHPDAN